MNNDLISRQAAIDAIDRLDIPEDMCVFEILSHIELEIGNLPSAQPEQRWIPSGEKPPEKGSYLVWMPFAPPKHRITVAEYCGGYWSIKTPVSAWMPLPEPYKGGEQDG